MDQLQPDIGPHDHFPFVKFLTGVCNMHNVVIRDYTQARNFNTVLQCTLPYSLKFSRLKIFTNFVGWSKAANFFPVKFQVNNTYNAWLEV